MFSAFVGTVFVGLILLGTVAICYYFMLKLLLPKQDRDFYILLPCDSKTEDIRKKAYGMRIKLNLLGDIMHSKIIVLDNGITEEERLELMKICKDSNGIYITEKEKLKDFLNGRV